MGDEIFPKPEDIKEPISGEEKRKRGRPPREKIPPKEEIPPEVFAGMADAVGALFALPFDFTATRTKREEWRLTDQEKAQLGEHASRVIMKYLPLILEKYMEELALGIFVFSLISKRMALTESKEKPKGEELK